MLITHMTCPFPLELENSTFDIDACSYVHSVKCFVLVIPRAVESPVQTPVHVPVEPRLFTNITATALNTPTFKPQGLNTPSEPSGQIQNGSVDTQRSCRQQTKMEPCAALDLLQSKKPGSLTHAELADAGRDLYIKESEICSTGKYRGTSLSMS